MSRTITALFDTRADAEAGRNRLIAAEVDADNVRIHDNTGMDKAGAHVPSYSTAKEPGLWESIKNAFLPDDDRHVYEEGVRRGGFLLTADVESDEVDEAIEALEEANSVDIEDRAASWRSEGWNSPASSGTHPDHRTDMDREPVDANDLEAIFAKRDADRGSQRTRSYVADKPWHEQRSARPDLFGGSDCADRDPACGDRSKPKSSTLAGMSNEAVGNIKQGVAGLTGNDALEQEGREQERKGEAQQGKPLDNDD